MAITKVHADMIEGIEEALEPHLEGYVHKTGGTLTGDLHLQSGLIINGATKEKVHEVTVENVPPEPIVSDDYWSYEKVKKLMGDWNYEEHGNNMVPQYTVRQFPKAIVDHFPVSPVPSGEILEESTTFSLTSDGTHGIMVDYGPKFGYRGKYAVWKCDKPYEWDENSEVVCIGEFGGDSEPSPQPDWPVDVPRSGGYSKWRRSAGLQFSPDGLKLFHTGADELSLTLGWHQLTKPYDVSTSLNLNGSDFPALNDTIDCRRYNLALAGFLNATSYRRVAGLSFRPDGKAFFILWYIYKQNYFSLNGPSFLKPSNKTGCRDGGQDMFNLTVTQQNLNTPWDISASSLGDYYTIPRELLNKHPNFSCVDMWPICGSITWSSNGQYMYTSTGILYKDRGGNNTNRRHTVLFKRGRNDPTGWKDHPWDLSQGGTGEQFNGIEQCGWEMEDRGSPESCSAVHNGMAWNEDGSKFYSMIRRGAWEDAPGSGWNPNDKRPIFETRVYEVVPSPPPMEIDLNPQDGTMQTYTIEDEGEIAFVDKLENGQTLTLMLDCADPQKTPETVNWPDAIWSNTEEPPSLETGSLVVSLWKTKNILYGAVIGNYNDSDLSQQS